MKNQSTVSCLLSLYLFIIYLLYIGTTIQDIRLELAKEDAVEAAKGVISPHTTSATVFLTKGLEIEAQQ